jgi:ribonuclease P protein component
VQRRFRLTRSTDFKRVRNLGKSYAHPLVVLIASPSHEDHIRVGVTAGKALGIAVERNRAKRLLREATRPILPSLRPGWDVILIARQPLLSAGFEDIQFAIRQLLRRAKLLEAIHDPALPAS